jgi:RNA polymerase sigma-70 factor (ECF subfamily)
MNDAIIIEGCLSNSPVAQRELYSRYSPKMLSVCFRFASSREDAEDMLQEGFIKVFTQMQSFQNKGAFEGWIRKIIVHTCINVLKRNKKFNQSVDLEEADFATVREAIPSIMQAKQVVECIRLLPIGYRTVLNLFAIEGFSHREISELMGIEESTSRSQYTRAKSMLEHILISRKIIDKKEPKTNLIAAM